MAQSRRVERIVRVAQEAVCQPHAPGVARILGAPRGRIGAAAAPPSNLLLPPAHGPLHFTHRVWLLCEDIARRMSCFRHVNMKRVLVTFVSTRNQRRWGLQAKLVPLSFADGRATQSRKGRLYQIQELYVGDTLLKYVITFYLPRFLNQTFDEKLITIMHELYHIGPDFRGDVRRFENGSVHAGSKRRYDQQMLTLAREYLALEPPRTLIDFLRLSFAELEARYGAIVGVRISSPKLIPVSSKI